MNSTASSKDNPVNNSDLRKFGLLFGTIVVSLFGLLIPFLIDKPFPLWPFYTAAVFISVAIIFPRALILAYVPWMKFGEIAGWINTRIILSLLFFIFITPFGLMMRLFGSDLLNRKFDAKRSSYRVVHAHQPKEHMEKPY